MRFLINLTASATIAAAASFSARIAAPCPTNTVPWPCGDGGTTCEPFAAAKKNALKWLRKNAPPSDLYNAATLFGTLGGVDGMDAGVAAVAANATLTAKARWPWARSVPCDVFRDYVLPYACANEPRTLMMNVSPLPDASLPPSSAARLVTFFVCPFSTSDQGDVVATSCSVVGCTFTILARLGCPSQPWRHTCTRQTALSDLSASQRAGSEGL